MDARHLDYEDESLVRAVLLAAYPTERPIFSQRRGAQIIRAAAVEALERPHRRLPVVGSRLAVCLAAAVALLAGTASAAGAALPGQPLYPVKRVVERAMVAITGDDVQAARLELRFAERRLGEAAAISRQAAEHDLTPITQQFNEHLHAAVELGGDHVADEIQQLERSHIRRDQATEPLGSDSAPTTAADPQAPDREGVGEPTPTASATPDQDRAPAATPSPLAKPSPSSSASPLPHEDVAPTLPVEPGPVPVTRPEVDPVPDPQPVPEVAPATTSSAASDD